MINVRSVTYKMIAFVLVKARFLFFFFLIEGWKEYV